MNIDRLVFRIAGVMVLISVALGWYVNHWWYCLAAFVGANMLQASFTGFCPLAKILKGVGAKPGQAFD